MKERLTILAVTIMTLAACAVFASTLVHASLYYQAEEEVSPSEAGIATSSAVAEINREVPLRLSISSIKVDAKVQSVGIGKSGNMAVPTNFTDVGWYRYGPAPGQKGSAVIDGHVDNGLGISAVFKHIVELQVGDDIFVDAKEGSRLHFVVSDVETYAVADVPADVLFNRADVPRLNLITCAGVWDPKKKVYDQRVVVYAKLVQ